MQNEVVQYVAWCAYAYYIAPKQISALCSSALLHEWPYRAYSLAIIVLYVPKFRMLAMSLKKTLNENQRMYIFAFN